MKHPLDRFSDLLDELQNVVESYQNLADESAYLVGELTKCVAKERTEERNTEVSKADGYVAHYPANWGDELGDDDYAEDVFEGRDSCRDVTDAHYAATFVTHNPLPLTDEEWDEYLAGLEVDE